MGKRQLSFLVATLLSLISNVNAQAGVGAIDQALKLGFVTFLDNLFVAEITSPTEIVTLILIPVVAISAAYWYLLYKGLEIIETRFGKNMGRDITGTVDVSDIGEFVSKIVAVVLGIWTVMVFGNFLLIIGALTGFGVLVWITYWFGISLFGFGFNRDVGGVGDSGGNGGIDMDQVKQVMDERLEGLGEEISDEIDKSKTIQQKFQELKHSDFEEAAQSFVNDDRVPEGARKEMQQILDEFEDSEQREMTLLEVIEDIAGKEESELEQLTEVEEMREWVDGELSHILDRGQEVERRYEELENRLEDLSGEQEEILKRIEEAQESGDAAAVEELREDLAGVHQQFEALENQVHETYSEFEELFSGEIDEVRQRLQQIEDEIEQIEKEEADVDKELDEAEEDAEADEEEIEDEKEKLGDEEKWIAKQENADREKEMLEEIHQDIAEEQEIAREEKSVLDEEEDVESKLEGYTQEEEKAIRQDLKKMEKARQMADNLEEQFQWLFGEIEKRKEMGEEAEKGVEEDVLDRAQMIDRAVADLNQLSREAEKAQTQQQLNQVYGEAAKIFERLGDRSRFESEENINEVGNAERALFEKLNEKAEDLNMDRGFERLW